MKNGTTCISKKGYRCKWKALMLLFYISQSHQGLSYHVVIIVTFPHMANNLSNELNTGYIGKLMYYTLPKL
jgi:hypothetical protein